MRRRRRTDAAGADGGDEDSPGRVPEALLKRMMQEMEAAGGRGVGLPRRASPRADGRDGGADDASYQGNGPQSPPAGAATAGEAGAEDDEAVHAVKLQRARDAHAYVSGILPYVVALVTLLLVSTLQVGYYYYALPDDPQICYLNRMNQRWLCESAEGSYGLKHQYKLSTSNKDSLCGWYGIFTIMLDLVVVTLAMTLPNCLIREYRRDSLTDQHHLALLLAVGRSALAFGSVTHGVLLIVFQVLFDGINHGYKPFQGFTMWTLLATYFAFAAGIACNMLRRIAQCVHASKAAEMARKEERTATRSINDLGLSGIEAAALGGAPT